MTQDTQGRFELDESAFKALIKKNGQASSILDFKTLLPDIFVGTDKMPRLLKEIWRTPVDEYLEKDKGYYYLQEKGCLLHLTFEKTSKEIANTKTNVIGRTIKTALQERINNKTAPEGAPAQAAAQENKTDKGNEAFQKVLEGLRENPSMEEVKIWVTRALQNAHHSSNMPSEIVQLLQSCRIYFMPYWNAESSVLVGSTCEINLRGIPAPNEGQLIRDNIALIAAGCLDLARLAKQGGKAITVIPIYIRTLLEKDINELILALLKKTPEQVRKCIIFELRGVTGGQIQPSVREALQILSQNCRAITVDTGILTQPFLDDTILKFHAYGHDFNDIKMPPQQMLNLMKKYVAAYHGKGVKTFIKNIPNYPAFDMGSKIGYTYLSAPSILKPSIGCNAARLMSLEEVRKLSQS